MIQEQEIILRKPILDDLDFILQMENNPEIWAVSQTTEPFSRLEIENFIINSSHDLLFDLQLRYIIAFRNGGEQIGSIDLFNYMADNESAQIGITILEKYRGLHFGAKALEILISKAFNEIKLRSLSCNVFIDNIPSIRLFESKNFVRLKMLKSNTIYKGVPYDEYVYELKRN